MQNQNIGKRYGKLTIVRYVIDTYKSNKYECLCDCGDLSLYYLHNVIAPNKFFPKSCKNCAIKKGRSGSHHMSKTRQYRIWVNMRVRCNDKNAENYHSYGGRGISYDKHWDKFENFWQDMRTGYFDGLTLDRIDNNGNYCKENCRWATIKQQNLNKNNNRLITVDNQTKTLSEWSRIFNIKPTTISWRINNGKALDEIFLKPSERQSRTIKTNKTAVVII